MTNLKSLYYEERETQDITKQYYQIQRNLIISILSLIQNNHILSRLPTSEARRGTAEQ